MRLHRACARSLAAQLCGGARVPTLVARHARAAASSPSAPAASESLFTREAAAGVCVFLLSGGALLYLAARDSRAGARAREAPLYEGNPVVYLDVADGEAPVGRLVVQLRADLVPATAENFRALCVGAGGWGYRSSPLHAVEKGRRVFGGDPYGAGRAGCSAAGGTFPDESFALRHDAPGVVGMRNHGPDTNGSQFYVTFAPLPELDGRSVAVGTLLEGWDVLRALDAAARVSGGRFAGKRDFRVVAAGELKEYAGRERVPRVVDGGTVGPSASALAAK